MTPEVQLGVKVFALRIIREDSGEKLYLNASATDHVLDEATIVTVTRDGRRRC